MDLALLRKKKNMTQAAVAQHANINRTTYTNIEQGHRRPSVEVAKRIANVLEFDWTDFFKDGETKERAV